MSQSEFLKQYEKYIFLKLAYVKESKFPGEADGLLTIYESILILKDFIRILKIYCRKLKNIVEIEGPKIANDIRPNHPLATQRGINDLKENVVKVIPEFYSHLEKLMNNQEKKGFGTVTTNLSVYGAIAVLLTGLYIQYQGVLEILSAGLAKDFDNFDNMVSQMDVITDETMQR